jgi:hypothetical protein
VIGVLEFLAAELKTDSESQSENDGKKKMAL